MNKAQVHFEALKGQQLKLMDPLKKYATGTRRYLQAVFNLGEHWKEYDKIIAVWTVNGSDQYTSEIDTDGLSDIPAEAVAKPGTLKVNLCAGIVEDETLKARLTSYQAEALQLIKALL